MGSEDGSRVEVDVSGAWLIAAREIRERSRFFVVAAALATIPFLTALAPAAEGNRALAIASVASVIAIAYGGVVALTLGASTVGRDVREKRLSFYFSKPVAPAALWLGKVGASLFIALASLLIIALPASVVARSDWDTLVTNAGESASWIVRIGLVALFFIGHTAATMTRSRSIFVAVDFALALITLGVLALMLWPILVGEGRLLAMRIVLAFGAAALLILALAPIWQLANGRTDARRSHAAWSKFVWSGVTVVLLITAFTVTWLRSATPADLIDVRTLSQAPAGGWAVVMGVAKYRLDYKSSFVVNTSSGKWMRLSAPMQWAMWSRDGRVVAWPQRISPLAEEREEELYTASFAPFEVKPTGLRTRALRFFTLSDDGTRVAVADGGVASVHDVARGATLASARVAEDHSVRMFFLARDVVRITRFPNRPTPKDSMAEVSELDVRTGHWTRLGSRESDMPLGLISSDGTRALLRTTKTELVDGRTLTPIAIVSPTPYGSTILDDGSIVAMRHENGARIRLLDANGAPRTNELTLPGMGPSYVTGETTDGKIIVRGEPPFRMRKDGAHQTVFVIDRARWVIERSIPGFSGGRWWVFDSPQSLYDASHPFIGAGADGRLMVWDPRTGKRKHFLSRRSAG